MFDNLSDRLNRTFRKITGKARLNHDNIQDTLREVRKALLEADVALPVVKQFIDRLVSSLFPFLNYEDTNQNQNMNLKYTYFIKVFKSRGPSYFVNSRKCFPCPPDQMTNFETTNF